MNTTQLNTENILKSLKANEYNTIRVHEVKNGSKWIEKETSLETFTDAQKDKFLSKDNLSWFRNLGGTESVKQGRFKGIGCTINVSTDPTGTERKITYFLF